MTAAAHERWFVSDQGLPTRWGDLLRPEGYVPVGIAVLCAAAVYVLWVRCGRRPLLPGPLALGATPERLAVTMGWVPLLLAVHTAVPLLVSGVQGQLFAPNLEMLLPASAFVGLAEVAIALLLFYGLFARYAALGLAGIWVIGAFLFGPSLLIEQVIFLGIAAFFWIVGRGPIAVDRLFGDWAGARVALLPYAVPALRVATGLGIVWLAFTEKLLNLPLALRFVEAYPFVNFAAGLGLPITDVAFILAAGTVELLAGILLVSGAFPRIVILLLWLPFNLTLTVFGWRELVGHLPIYATLAIVLFWGRGGEKDLESLRKGLIPLRPEGTPDPRRDSADREDGTA
ncbi:MAG TPA: DoxX protein [Gemmatimonadota bacterium]|nr:DoxX protein [Gemmatimonadota bacterium]